jgi:hypothetical protein
MIPPPQAIRFRTSPLVELKQLDELAAKQRELLRELENDPEFYRIVVPKLPLTMNLKSVSRETAELLRSLATPSSLDINDEVVDMVLDGFLEIENGNGFVFGADALPLVSGAAGFTLERVGALTPAVPRLSRDALLHAQDLETNDTHALTMALYFYNRIPASPFWKTRLANRGAVLTYVGADRGTLRTLLDREWVAATSEGWLSWSSKSRTARDAAEVTYKLYVSPRPERMPDAFEIVVRVLSAFPETHFKIGDDAAGLLRPDKFVAYFKTREDLDEAAAELRRELAGCDAHGVPFTAGLDDRGLLSWGMDPPLNDRALQWLRSDSWRLWLAKRLGAAIAIAKLARTPAAVEPCRFAVERARRHGVDVETWTPSASLWSMA